MDSDNESVEMELLNPVKSTSQSPYNCLLDSLLNNDFDTFRTVIEKNLGTQPPRIDVNYAYPNRSGETCLDIACRDGLTEFVKLLLKYGANVNRVNEAHNRGPIHFATENGHVAVLEALLKEDAVDRNLEAGQQTALHIAVKKNNLECATVLLEKGGDPYIPNVKGVTALHMAAMLNKRDMVKLILAKSTHELDIDHYTDYNGQTTRDILRKKMPDIELPAKKILDVKAGDLKNCLNANDEPKFLKYLKKIRNDALEKVAEELIEKAASKNLVNALVAVLERTTSSGYNLEKAALAAIRRGSPNGLRRILNTNVAVGKKLLLEASIQLGIPGEKEDLRNRLECFKMILARDNVDVRCTDGKGNTPLHYAARANCPEAVTLLLEKGSYIGHLNNIGVPPIADIPMSTLSRYLDNCVQARRQHANEYTIEFDYKCLMPHGVSSQPSNGNPTDEEKREIGVLQFMADDKALKHLLKHPLLSSFLYLKWRRIRRILYLNLGFYFVFSILLNAHIFCITYQNSMNATNSGDSGQDKVADTCSTVDPILWGLTLITVMILAIREILQLASSPCYYMSCPENWLEIILTSLSVAVLFGAGAEIATLVILLSAWELVTLIGQHPKMSTGIEMLKTVFFNFMRFFFLYAFLILAFALAFFTLFQNVEDNKFPNIGQSLFKTIIMLTGEFEAENIPFLSRPILSHLIFVSFVFLIAIVLFNLLNGLAVSDTAEILGEAELVGLISRIKLVGYLENVAIRAPLVCGDDCLLYQGILYFRNFNPLTFLVNRILLFSEYLKDGKISVEVNDSLEVPSNPRDNDSEDKVIPKFKFDKDIIKQAKDVLSSRGRKSDTENVIRELNNIKERLSSIEISLHATKPIIEIIKDSVVRNEEN